MRLATFQVGLGALKNRGPQSPKEISRSRPRTTTTRAPSRSATGVRKSTAPVLWETSHVALKASQDSYPPHQCIPESIPYPIRPPFVPDASKRRIRSRGQPC